MRALFAGLLPVPVGVGQTPRVFGSSSVRTTAPRSGRTVFDAGRAMARRALADAGLPNGPVSRGERGMPVWPAESVGSITHCPDYVAAVVVSAEHVRGLGIDAEPCAVVTSRLYHRISVPAERDWVSDDPRRARILFSIKESVYKALFPLTRLPLGFRDVRIVFGAPGFFEVEPLFEHSLELGRCYGRFLVRDGLIRSAVVVDRHD